MYYVLLNYKVVWLSGVGIWWHEMRLHWSYITCYNNLHSSHLLSFHHFLPCFQPSTHSIQPAHHSPQTNLYAYLFITALPIRDLPCKVQQEWNIAKYPNISRLHLHRDRIIFGVNTCLIGDTSLNLGNDIHFMWDFRGSHKKQCTYFHSSKSIQGDYTLGVRETVWTHTASQIGIFLVVGVVQIPLFVCERKCI